LLFGDALAIAYHGTIGASISVSPDSRWIATVSRDGTIRLWPMPPSGEATPFHTLPYEGILTRLRALTNLRVVPDEQSGTGYKIEFGPFPGWKKFPEW
jgi:hypothetical protein